MKRILLLATVVVTTFVTATVGVQPALAHGTCPTGYHYAFLLKNASPLSIEQVSIKLVSGNLSTTGEHVLALWEVKNDPNDHFYQVGLWYGYTPVGGYFSVPHFYIERQGDSYAFEDRGVAAWNTSYTFKIVRQSGDTFLAYTNGSADPMGNFTVSPSPGAVKGGLEVYSFDATCNDGDTGYYYYPNTMPLAYHESNPGWSYDDCWWGFQGGYPTAWESWGNSAQHAPTDPRCQGLSPLASSSTLGALAPLIPTASASKSLLPASASQSLLKVYGSTFPARHE